MRNVGTVESSTSSGQRSQVSKKKIMGKITSTILLHKNSTPYLIFCAYKLKVVEQNKKVPTDVDRKNKQYF